MPSTYAHYRFGKEIKDLLDTNKQKIIEQYPTLFQLGVHGPDLLFYYHPLHHNDVSALGNTIHSLPAEQFFGPLFQRLKETDSPAALAYLYGYLCHFGLDTTCHTYIEKIQAEHIACHSEIEDDLERALLVLDHYDPVRYPLYQLIDYRKEDIPVIQSFYPTLDEHVIKTAIKGMRFYHHLLYCPHPFKRRLLIQGIKWIGQHPNLTGHIVMPEPDLRLQSTTAHLLTLYEKAKHVAIELFASLDDALLAGQVNHPYYQRTFDINEEEIQIEV